MWQLMLMFLGVMCAVSSLAYTIGRRRGLISGRDAGQHRTPLELRTRLLTTGKCPICNHDYTGEGDGRQGGGIRWM